MRKIIISLVIWLAVTPVVFGAVDLIWEADSIVPAGYPGKPLATPQTKVKVIALPWIEGAGGNPTPAEQLWFWWYKDGAALKELSGLGKNTFSYIANSSGANQIAVIVRDRAYQELAKAAISVPVSQPKVLFYKKDPVLGALNHLALVGDFRLTSSETAFLAEPFFFNTGQRLQYAWKLADQKGVPDTDNPRGITISLPPGSGEGSNVLDLTVSNADNPLQVAKQKINLIFNANYDLFDGNTF
jgi:hypothetical protein